MVSTLNAHWKKGFKLALPQISTYDDTTSSIASRRQDIWRFKGKIYVLHIWFFIFCFFIGIANNNKLHGAKKIYRI